MGTKILTFCQTPRGKEFFYLCYFYPKGHLMAWIGLEAVRDYKFQSKIFRLSLGIFRNFWDCFWIVQVEFLGLFSENLV